MSKATALSGATSALRGAQSKRELQYGLRSPALAPGGKCCEGAIVTEAIPSTIKEIASSG